MGLTRLQTHQMVQQTALPVLGAAARTQQQTLNSSIEAGLDVPGRLYATHPTADAVLNIAASRITRGNGTLKAAMAGTASLLSSVLSTINFQTGSTSGATFTLTFPNSTVGQFRRLALTLRPDGTIKGVFSAEAASVGALANPLTLFRKGYVLGWVDLQCTAASPGRFKTAGSATSIIENAVSGTARIALVDEDFNYGTEVVEIDNSMSPYTVDPTIVKTVICDTSGGGIIVNLPDPGEYPDWDVEIHKATTDGNAVTPTALAEAILTASTDPFSGPYTTRRYRAVPIAKGGPGYIRL